MDDIYGRSGRIFDIQRYSIHDGPGIRTIVFFKGCSLRCRWCCNPESQSSAVETMRMNGTEKTVGEEITVRALIGELEKDRPHYRRSGGGVTLSGGEALVQPDFAEALLIACREHGLTTAIETAAFVRPEVVERIIPLTDYVLMDVKHMNSEKHRAFTGQPNALILSNALRVARLTRSLTIRVPVVPTFNDTEEEIAAIARFAASLPGVSALHLLPYHRLGQDKYAGIGRTYTLPDLRPPVASRMEALRAAAEAASRLHVQIGG